MDIKSDLIELNEKLTILKIKYEEFANKRAELLSTEEIISNYELQQQELQSRGFMKALRKKILIATPVVMLFFFLSTHFFIGAPLRPSVIMSIIFPIMVGGFVYLLASDTPRTKLDNLEKSASEYQEQLEENSNKQKGLLNEYVIAKNNLPIAKEADAIALGKFKTAYEECEKYLSNVKEKINADIIDFIQAENLNTIANERISLNLEVQGLSTYGEHFLLEKINKKTGGTNNE